MGEASRPDRLVPLAVLAHVSLLALGAAPASAVDGVTEINQSSALDAGGFPVSVGTGSYVLTSNLAVPAGTTGILVADDDVTIDLNGFTIDGSSGGCTGSGASIVCPGGAGFGIDGLARDGVVVRDGTLKHSRQICLRLGDDAVVERLRVTGCTGSGIALGSRGQVREGIVTRNGQHGILGGDGLSVVDSISHGNGMHGIRGDDGARVSGSIAASSGQRGIRSLAAASIQDSVAADNELGGIEAGDGSRVAWNAASANPSGPGIEAGDDALVEGNAAGNNGTTTAAHGIQCGARCSVLGNAARDNAIDGIHLAEGGTASFNASSGNADDGIECDAASASSCSAIGNTAVFNSGYGLRLSAAGAVVGVYRANTFNGNTAGDVSQVGLDPAPGYHNTCSGTVPCP